MTDKQLQIPIDKIKADFQQFLAPEHNRRIIFSGPFGIGKTYFLNEFFKEKEDIYFPIFLRPINYSLLSNEDVFKLIKYDILAQLVQDDAFNIEQEFDFSKTEYLQHFLSENRFLILRNLLKAIPKIRNVISAADELEELFSKYQEGIGEINSNGELVMLKEFQQESENNFLLEYDEASDYIASKLNEIANLKSNGETKIQKVLIIDDLDRLDPEHIFRLFNVFSAHFDQVQYYENEDGNDNKFGFDKIIFVCDIENIRKIFAHKYGSEVDFSGYIDKFYSIRPFYINNDKYINEYIVKGLEFENVPDEVIRFIRILISYFFLSGKINLRKLENLFKEYIPKEQFKDDDWVAVDALYDVKAKHLNWIRYLSIFKPIFGNYSKLINEINQIPERPSTTISKGEFKKIEELVITTYSVLNTGHIRNILGQTSTSTDRVQNQKFKWSLGGNFIEVYMSLQRNYSRFILYDVTISNSSDIDKDFRIYDFKIIYKMFISAGLRLFIISE